MSRRVEYRLYLESSDWKEQRDLALERTAGFCQYCGEIATQVHHVRYPKRFGHEHPHSLIPVCERCHNISHGVQDMNPLSEPVLMNELAPNGMRLNYLLSNGRVYASSASWSKALQVPEGIKTWFETGLARMAIMYKDRSGGSFEMNYKDRVVYRWPAVVKQLRHFDREWHNTQFRSRPIAEQKEIEKFHQNFERLVDWGDDLQERALSSLLNSRTSPQSTVTPEGFIEALKKAVAPRLQAHDEQLNVHDVLISEIKEASPLLRDKDEFITVRQAISEQGLDPTVMPLHPSSKENFSGLAGQRLKTIRAEQGPSEIVRVDGQAVTTEVNTYRRHDIYSVLEEIQKNKPQGLPF